MKKKAMLVVSFGTTHSDTREKTIDMIEQNIAEAFPDYKIYRAWTSKMIIAKLAARDGIIIDSVSEAMERIKKDGITEVVVQPTHIVNGIENDAMVADVKKNANDINSIVFGNPLLTAHEDYDRVIDILMGEMDETPADTALIFMGHGTTHHANATYSALDYKFKDRGYKNVFVGTVEAYPSLETLIKNVNAAGFTKVIITPFLVVAGEHAKNDMSGDDEDSWRNRFESSGFSVSCLVKGIGEYRGIRDMFAVHALDAILSKE